MKRSSWKLPYLNPNVYRSSYIRKKVIMFKARNFVLSKALLDKRLCIYNGTWFLSSDISNNFIGLRLGQLSFTKRSDSQLHLKKKSKKKSNKKK